MTRIGFVSSDQQGGGRVRSFWPAAALKAKGYNVVHAGPAHPPPGSCDVLFVHRPLASDGLAQLRAQQAAGTAVIADEDDDLSAAHILPFWKGNDLEFGQLVKNHDAYLAAADGLTVTTGRLRSVYRRLNKRIWVCPNYLPAEVGGLRWYSSDDDVLVGWTGILDTHKLDVEWLAPVANRAFRGAYFSTIGDMATPRVLQLDQSIVPWEAIPFLYDWVQFYKHQAKVDIGIVPLADNPLNHAKSWLKALEYMTLGIPVVVRDLPEQRKLVRHGDNGLLAKTPGEFAECTQRLIRDAGLRQHMAAAAKQTGVDMQLERNTAAWEAVIDEFDRVPA